MKRVLPFLISLPLLVAAWLWGLERAERLSGGSSIGSLCYTCGRPATGTTGYSNMQPVPFCNGCAAPYQISRGEKRFLVFHEHDLRMMQVLVTRHFRIALASLTAMTLALLCLGLAFSKPRFGIVGAGTALLYASVADPTNAFFAILVLLWMLIGAASGCFFLWFALRVWKGRTFDVFRV